MFPVHTECVLYESNWCELRLLLRLITSLRLRVACEEASNIAGGSGVSITKVDKGN